MSHFVQAEYRWASAHQSLDSLFETRMKLKTKLYIAAALFFMLLGHFVGRIMTLVGIVIVIGFVVVLAWPVIKRLIPKRKST